MCIRDRAYDALTKGEGLTAPSATEGIQASYDRNETDDFVKPTVVVKDGAPVATIKDGDSIIFYNFRPDRAREITHAFCDDDFKGFDRPKRLEVKYICFTEYDPTIPNKEVAFHKVEVTNTFGEWLAANHMTQARIAETEKYAHVTFFFNGGVETPNEGEDRILVNSPKVEMCIRDRGQIADVGSVQTNGSAGGVVKPFQKLDDRGFSGAGGSHDTKRLSRLHSEGKIMQDLMSVLLVEGHVVKFDFSPDLRKRYRPLRLRDGGLRLVDFSDLSVASHAGGKIIGQPAQHFHGPDDIHGILHEGCLLYTSRCV